MKALASMPRPQARLVTEKIRLLAAEPHAVRPSVKKLQGRPGYRLRVGDWRVIYEVVDDQVVILVLDVGHRSEVYR